MQNLVIDMLLTGTMVDILKKTNSTEIDACWHMLISRYISDKIRNNSNTRCWEDVPDALAGDSRGR